jgi:hypothetical protein
MGVDQMGEEAQKDSTTIEHFVYGSHEGYRMKAYSKGIDLDVHTDPFEGMFLPIKQSDIKNIDEIRMILPVDRSSMLLSRIIKGGKDDHARDTMANHTAVVPRDMLKNNEITYEEVDAVMEDFETKNIDSIGDIPPLDVPQTDKRLDMAELKKYIPEEVVKNLILHYMENEDKKVFLHYRTSNAEKRTRAAYLLSMLIDMKLNVMPLSIFTDVPYGGAIRVFNLVLSRAMIGIKPGGDWVMLPVEKKRAWTGVDKKQFTKRLNEVLDDIYG